MCGESGFSAGGRGVDVGLCRFQAEGLFGEGRGGHIQTKGWGLCVELIVCQSTGAAEGGEFARRDAVGGQSKNRHIELGYNPRATVQTWTSRAPAFRNARAQALVVA